MGSPVPIEILDSMAAVERLPHRDYGRAQLALFIGRRDKGKTTAMNRYLEQGEPRVLATDPFDDFPSLAWPFYLRGEEGEEYAKSDADAALEDMAFWETACRRRVKSPTGKGSRAWSQRFFELCLPPSEHPLRNALLCLDEVTLHTGPIASEELQELVLQGRRYRVRMIAGCQRLGLIPGIFLSEATEMVIFQIVRPRDLDVIEDWGARHGQVKGELREAVACLGQGQCIVLAL